MRIVSVRRSLVVALATLGTASGAGAQTPEAAPGDTLALEVSIPRPDPAGGPLRYTVRPAEGVLLLGETTGIVARSGRDSTLVVPVRLRVPERQEPGPFSGGWVSVEGQDGTRTSVEIRVLVRGAPTVAPTAGGTSKSIEVEVTPRPHTVAPGSTVTLLYTVYNDEGSEERVRLRVHAGPGWTLLDPEVEEHELLIEGGDLIEGEIRLVAPADAPIGERGLIRLAAEVVGEPGGHEAQSFVTIAKRGGLRPGVTALTGTSSLSVSQLDDRGLDGARFGGALDLSGRLGRQSTLSVSLHRGPRENLSNYRFHGTDEVRYGGNLRHAGWDLSLGGQISSTGGVLTGPFVRGQGAHLRRTTGRLAAELTLARPTDFSGGEAGGRLLRGSAGVRTAAGTLALVASDFLRPVGGYSTQPQVIGPVVDPDSLEELERERAMSAPAPSNRVQGVGLDLDLRRGREHRLTLRGGGLRLASAGGVQNTAPSAEAQYSLSGRTATLSLRWREMPPSLQGVYLPGSDRSVDGSLRLLGELRLVGRAYGSDSRVLGSEYRAEGRGTSLGLRFARKGGRVEVRGNHRESRSFSTSVRRTASGSASLPLGSLVLSGNVEVGEQTVQRSAGATAERLGNYRADLRWTGTAGSAWLGASHYALGAAPPRTRVDFTTSLKLQEMEVAGGAWAARGPVFGPTPGAWASVALPLRAELSLVAGVDYGRWGDPPSSGTVPAGVSTAPWRASLAVRQRLTLPLPFARAQAEPVGAGAAAGEGPPAGSGRAPS